MKIKYETEILSRKGKGEETEENLIFKKKKTCGCNIKYEVTKMMWKEQ